MERKLRALFDYQKFAPDASLSALIDSVHARHPSRELNMEEMEWVSAAGVPGAVPGKKDGDKTDGTR